jgi:NADP-dependent 3-hydroxy acid dehydrogenase YdfG
MELDGKVVLVTGGSRGIGLETARAFASAGARVVLGARTESALVSAVREIEARGGSAFATLLDVTSDESVTQAVAAATRRFGRIDVLVNNAGVSAQAFLADARFETLQQQMEVNYFGVVRMVRAVLPGMLERGAGTILNIGSVAGRVPYPSMATYGASKAALHAFSQALRGEVAHRGVRVVTVIPGHSSGGAGPTVALDGPTLETPAQIARSVVRAALRPRRELVSGLPNRIFLRVARLSPWFAEGTMLSFAKRSLPQGTFAPRATSAVSGSSSAGTRDETRAARRSPAGS